MFGNFLVVAQQTHHPAAPPSKSVHKYQYQYQSDWRSSIVLNHLSYTTDTILPDLGTAE